MRGFCLPLVFTVLLGCASPGAQTQRRSPGSQPYNPTRIDWLTTTLEASIRQGMTEESGFSLDITYSGSDPETVVISVRYQPEVDRQIMNMTIDSARRVIHLAAKNYGWDKWVKIREDVQLLGADSKSE